jgi:acyl dehydratase
MSVQEEAKLGDGRITDEGLAKLRSLTGTKLRITQKFNGLASREAIRNFANGIGDPNPLWLDLAYARKTRYGRIVAPPSWYYSVFPTWISLGLPGVHGFHAGTDWQFLKPVYEGDTVIPECVFTGYKEKPASKFAGRTVILYYESNFFNQKDELLAKAKSWSIRAERSAARRSGKYAEIQLPHPWKEEELKRIEADVLTEKPRGTTPRYWEDVQVGQELEPVIKGPFGITDMIAFCVGAAPVQLLAHRTALQLYKRHPAWAFRDPATHALEPIYGVHYNKAAANNAGLSYPYDVGTQRQCWLIHLLTDWMGDDGWIKSNYAEYRQFVYHSDVVWFRGKITKKYVDENGECCVDIETSAINQRGNDTAPGKATIILPSKEKGSNPLDRRLA